LPPYQIIESNYLSKEELHQVTILEEALEIYWNKKRTLHTLKYITQRYSIFDFLLGLGNHFKTRKHFHKYALVDVYDIIIDYVKDNYPDDLIIPQIIAIDYYLQHKVKPKILYHEEYEMAEKIRFIDKFKLNHHKYRFVIMPIDFDFELWETESIIQKGQYDIVIQYNGTAKPQVIKLVSIQV
jgi:hypothetical protein